MGRARTRRGAASSESDARNNNNNKAPSKPRVASAVSKRNVKAPPPSAAAAATRVSTRRRNSEKEDEPQQQLQPPQRRSRRQNQEEEEEDQQDDASGSATETATTDHSDILVDKKRRLSAGTESESTVEKNEEQQAAAAAVDVSKSETHAIAKKEEPPSKPATRRKRAKRGDDVVSAAASKDSEKAESSSVENEEKADEGEEETAMPIPESTKEDNASAITTQSAAAPDVDTTQLVSDVLNSYSQSKEVATEKAESVDSNDSPRKSGRKDKRKLEPLDTSMPESTIEETTTTVAAADSQQHSPEAEPMSPLEFLAQSAIAAMNDNPAYAPFSEDGSNHGDDDEKKGVSKPEATRDYDLEAIQNYQNDNVAEETSGALVDDTKEAEAIDATTKDAPETEDGAVMDDEHDQVEAKTATQQADQDDSAEQHEHKEQETSDEHVAMEKAVNEPKPQVLSNEDSNAVTAQKVPPSEDEPQIAVEDESQEELPVDETDKGKQEDIIMEGTNETSVDSPVHYAAAETIAESSPAALEVTPQPQSTEMETSITENSPPELAFEKSGDTDTTDNDQANKELIAEPQSREALPTEPEAEDSVGESSMAPRTEEVSTDIESSQAPIDTPNKEDQASEAEKSEAEVAASDSLEVVIETNSKIDQSAELEQHEKDAQEAVVNEKDAQEAVVHELPETSYVSSPTEQHIETESNSSVAEMDVSLDANMDTNEERQKEESTSLVPQADQMDTAEDTAEQESLEKGSALTDTPIEPTIESLDAPKLLEKVDAELKSAESSDTDLAPVEDHDGSQEMELEEALLQNSQETKAGADQRYDEMSQLVVIPSVEHVDERGSASQSPIAALTVNTVTQSPPSPDFEHALTDLEERGISIFPPLVSQSESLAHESAAVEKIPTLNLNRIKLKLFTEGRLVHKRGHYERLFSEYWSAMTLRLEATITARDVKKCQKVLASFLKSKRLRKLHNKLIVGKYHRRTASEACYLSLISRLSLIGLLERCMEPHALQSDVQDEYSAPWHSLTSPSTIRASKYVETTPVALEGTADKDSLSEMDFFSLYGRSDMPLIEESDTRSLGVMAQQSLSVASSCLPGALAIDPFVRSLSSGSGMRVSENAIWLLVVALKQFASNSILQAIDSAKAVNSGCLPPRSLPTISLSKRPSPSKAKDSPIKRQRTDEPIHCLGIFDFYSPVACMSTKSATGNSIQAAVSRFAFEKSLHAMFDGHVCQDSVMFEGLKDFLTSKLSIIVPAKERDLALSASVDKVANQNERRSPVQSGGLGRGAKSLASLMARTNKPVPPTSVANEGKGLPESSHLTSGDVAQPTFASTTDDDNEEKETDDKSEALQQSARRGKGFGVKNLAAMRARSSTITSTKMGDEDAAAAPLTDDAEPVDAPGYAESHIDDVSNEKPSHATLEAMKAVDATLNSPECAKEEFDSVVPTPVSTAPTERQGDAS
jgi:hypothetical protein